MAEARHFIDGRRTAGGPVRESLNPATGAVLGTFADGGAAEADAALTAATRAFASGWAHDRELRARVLFEIADELERRRDEVVLALARENGKVLGEAAFEVGLAIPKLRYYAGLALSDLGGAAETRPGLYSFSLRQPIGVAAVIVPWNSPVVLAIRSFAPALAAGCTVAMKLPGQTGVLNGLLLDIIAAAPSLPSGVLNAFTESGNEGAPLLVTDPRAGVISYTGSTAVGKAIMRQAADRLVPVSLELGGKSPMVVFDDADLEAAVPVLTRGITTFAGQFCMAGSRILVQRGVADELRERLAKSLTAVRVGPGDDPASDVGPMIDHSAVERVGHLVEAALEYATPIVRGGAPEDPELAGGAYFRPALLEVDRPDVPLVQQETFGPVATFEVFDDEDHAVTLANATDYGLAASVWSRDVDRPLRVARRIDAGTVWTNTWGVVNDSFEEGGFKHSGVGRLNGRRALEEFQEIKHLVHAPGR
ncbi:aldehyde dehydrogenase family protein [Amycolatopsis rhabdoformis]|uniref:Aldehyde dehydrogenase family protein n=1 Tax=Amycolatopsis rhabdoformis TaxID=1448059 RepID=A0ABZ1HX85_9PSEU|nr:aldehyde dehydrogenase family protein [Amycolatopsis rhabdoformis]WSE26812.1 aldehyde dehydrogenase family protein [Amycolatopsis rhabdoformis]